MLIDLQLGLGHLLEFRCLRVYTIWQREASPPKHSLDGASVVGFRGFSFFPMTDFLLSPYDLSLSFCR